MEMNQMMNVIGSVWSNLDKIHKDNPEKYNEIVNESVNWKNKLNTKPEAFATVEAITKVQHLVKIYENHCI